MNRNGELNCDNGISENKLNTLMGKNLRSIRKKQQLTQKKIEKDLGMAEKSISKLERGKSIFTPDNIELLSEYLKVPPTAFFEQESEKCKSHTDFTIFEKILDDLPEEDQRYLYFVIVRNWQMRNPDKDFTSVFKNEIRYMDYLKAVNRLLSLKN